MYCSRCGKKVLESMLFCPFCGSEIIIPDQDGEAPVQTDNPEPEKLSFDDRTYLWNGTEAAEAEQPEMQTSDEVKPEPVSLTKSNEEEAPPLPEPLPRLSFAPPTMERPEEEKPSPQPKEEEKPLDIFMERDHEEAQDDFDAFEAAQARRRSRQRGLDEDDDLDSEEREGFFHRHLRGLAAVVLLLALVAGLAVFAISETGQRTLAKLNMALPLKAEVYGKLGFEEYQSKNYGQSGIYYERALARDPGSFDFASSAAMAYIADGNTDQATEMLKKCIELRPEAVEPYIYLIRLYPNVDQRPAAISELLEEGYRRTGDARLKPLEAQEPRYIEMQ